MEVGQWKKLTLASTSLSPSASAFPLPSVSVARVDWNLCPYVRPMSHSRRGGKAMSKPLIRRLQIGYGSPHDRLEAYLSAWVASLERGHREPLGCEPNDVIWVPRIESPATPLTGLS